MKKKQSTEKELNRYVDENMALQSKVYQLETIIARDKGITKLGFRIGSIIQPRKDWPQLAVVTGDDTCSYEDGLAGYYGTEAAQVNTTLAMFMDHVYQRHLDNMRLHSEAQAYAVRVAQSDDTTLAIKEQMGLMRRRLNELEKINDSSRG